MKKRVYVLMALLVGSIIVLIFAPQISNAPTKTRGATDSPQTRSTTATEVTLSVGQKSKVGDLSIELKGPIEDSRCPSDVQCIWAGEVRTIVALSTARGSQVVSISSNKKAVSFDGHTVAITAVLPSIRKQGQQPASNDYRVMFKIEIVKK